jgi:hypothetical protein
LKIYGVKEALVETKRLTTDEDFWSRYLAHNEATREFKIKPLLHYLELTELFSSTTAVGKSAQRPKGPEGV